MDGRHIVQHQQQHKRDNFTFPRICLVRLLSSLLFAHEPNLSGSMIFLISLPLHLDLFDQCLFTRHGCWWACACVHFLVFEIHCHFYLVSIIFFVVKEHAETVWPVYLQKKKRMGLKHLSKARTRPTTCSKGER